MWGDAHHHRPTLKQQNKPFKSKHATKSSLKEIAKGRINRAPIKQSNTSLSSATTRLNRRNAAKQSQQKKRQELVATTRLFSGVDGTPRIVAIVPLCDDVSARRAAVAVAKSLDIDVEEAPEFGTWKVKVDRFKTSIHFILLPPSKTSFYGTLDAVKAADYVVFVLSTSTEVDESGELLLRCLQGQGLPDVVSVALSPESSAPSTSSSDHKARSQIFKSLLSFIKYFVPSQSKVLDLELSSDSINAARAVCEGRPSAVKWKDGRSWMVGEDVQWEENIINEGSDRMGTLMVTGTVRGAPLSANRLVHIPNFGDFQISKVMSAPPVASSRRPKNDFTMDVEPTTLSSPNLEEADDLIATLEPDTTANEQTWPTDAELQTGAVNGNKNGGIPDAREGTTPRSVRKVKVPKGMSAYQAAWIVEEEDDDDDGWEDDNEGDAKMEDDKPTTVGDEEEEMEMIDEEDESSMKGVRFEDLEEEEEGKQLSQWRSRQKEDSTDLSFPDEIDTPLTPAARIRFQRYRGLHSFRKSPWDPWENLPLDYAKIWMFEDYRRTERGVRRRAEEEGVEPGTRVVVHLKNVPSGVKESWTPTLPFVLFGLLQHEHKVSVLNFAIQRNTEYDGSVRSKDPLILCVGPRRFRTNPIFSQHPQGGSKSSNGVYKFERFLRHGSTSVATVYAPIVFGNGNMSCLWLKESVDSQAPKLVASGTFMNADPKRIVAKRIILTGHPFKVHKRTATIRYMFFNPDDVTYFAPVQLYTKYGRRGHIRESLGTHGYFKAHFDGPVNQMDTVCLALYKRVFPKWSSEFVDEAKSSSDAMRDVEMME